VIDDLLKLKELECRREEWASIVAHDFQQPINAIVMRTELLLRMGLGDSMMENLHHIRSAARHLGRMTGDLLDASQLETRRMSVVLSSVNLVAVVNEAIQRTPDAASLVLLSLPQNDPPVVLADAQRLEQIVTNLLSNALKYATSGTTIRVEITTRNREAEVSVINRGPGIASEELRTIFDRYVRSRRESAGTARSLGLGLYIAKGLAEAHGGRLWGESIPGETTAFHFTIPLESPRARRSALRAVAPDEPLSESGALDQR
jgi:signal transduction histidine kinase